MPTSDKPRSSILDDDDKLKDASHENIHDLIAATPENTVPSSAVNMAEQTPDLTHIEPSPMDDPTARSSADTHDANTKRLQELSLSSKEQETLKVHTQADAPPPPPQKDDAYIDPTPKTPQAPRSPLGLPSEYNEKELPSVPRDEQLDERKEDGEVNDDDQSEIQSIMEQFSDETKGPNETEIMSPRLELAEHFKGQQNQFPTRRSSLEPQPQSANNFPSSGPSSIPSPLMIPKPAPKARSDVPETPQSTSSRTGLPPPEPEPDQPFDFHRFLEQLRHRTADPVAKFLRSFLTEFGKKQWLVHEQVKIISDFLAFITNKMAQCEVWRNVSDAEFDNAKEGMEKLVMNRLYSQTFSPAIPPPPSVPRSASRNKRRELERIHGPGRRGQHQEDVERDEILAQKIRIYSWIRPEHLDIPSLGNNGRRFINLAQQELTKMKGYRAPRDKVICILNCCKVIFGLLKHSKNPDTSADSFVPILIYVVLKANPEHLISNVQYILRFRNQDKLGGEAGYYLSSLVSINRSCIT
ncbi:guanine nucleotide exchange factor Vps9, putative [Talaromyces stipitatus ATCC 10500]|uniref:Guanine nucleotide exchange factor Vps9, putative n=1 Tax=Talaromyces stipitatus (strain ATCC 10500 / CBS 375.48 / QM 6759 / NRRL 1006) TaxID=441959 RepID=B8LWJ7_TALSN|nr:guanine nucleotide exchange factor Vps9, putative [Talaromyces stipitatus ATCC 10500]EED24308.1 guanine nucleotide exchange factor Vps9, putative [Talaromyces stipitatus ATCC 10500]